MTQKTLFKNPRRAPPPPEWEVIARCQLGSSKFAQWRHVATGWIVERQPHPTALFPYIGKPPYAGEILINGKYAFGSLEQCKAAVLREIARGNV